MKQWHRRESPWEINPFEAYLLLAAVLQGLLVIIGVADPTSVRKALPAASAMYTWAGLLAGGGGLALAGLLWPWDPFTGVELRRIGLVGCAGGSGVYAVAAMLLGASGMAVAVYNLSFTIACGVLVHQVSQRLRLARAHLSEIRDETAIHSRKRR